MPDNDDISLDDLLVNQSAVSALATVERIAGDETVVKVTPFVAASRDCACDFALSVPRSSIDRLRRTEHTHLCCGRTLMVVEVTFTDQVYTDVFGQMLTRASTAAQTSSAATLPPRSVDRSGPTRRGFVSVQDRSDRDPCLDACINLFNGFDQMSPYEACLATNAYNACVDRCNGDTRVHHFHCPPDPGPTRRPVFPVS